MIYYVMFDTQKNRCTTDWIFHCEARNASEAKEAARQVWTERGNKSHQFHLYAHKSRIQDQRCLKIHAANTWVNCHEGDEVMNRFIRLGDHPWPKH